MHDELLDGAGSSPTHLGWHSSALSLHTWVMHAWMVVDGASPSAASIYMAPTSPSQKKTCSPDWVELLCSLCICLLLAYLPDELLIPEEHTHGILHA